MRAIILAAGRGKRMESFTAEYPKCLLEVNGKALLDWQLQAIKEAGIVEVAIVTGYKREFLVDRRLTEFHNAAWNASNMVASLKCASEWLMEDTCIISYSDIFYNTEAIEILCDTNADLAITYDRNWLNLWERRFSDPLSDAESFKLGKENFLVEIGKKAHSVKEIEGQYMGLLRFTPAAWEEAISILNEMPSQKAEVIQMTELLQKIIDRNRIPIKALPYTGEWGEVDFAEDLAVYEV